MQQVILDYMVPVADLLTWPRGYRKIVLNLAEHDFFLLINVKMPTIVGILTFVSGKIAFWAYLSLKQPNFLICYTYEHLNELSMKKNYNPRA